MTPTKRTHEMEAQDRDSVSADRSKGGGEGGGAGSCGWGPFQPRALQPLATVWSFVVVYMAFSFTHGLQGTYTISVLTTLEKRFNLPSYLSGLLVTISTCGYLVSVVFVSFFFAKRHPPRLFACSMLLTSLCALLYVIPHFIYGSGNDDIDDAAANAQSTAAAGERRLCGGAAGSLSNGTLNANGSCSEAERLSASDGVQFIAPALLMFMLSEFLQGVAGAPVWTVGLAYLDDHTGPKLSAKLIGLMYSVRFVSPIISFAMGGYCLSLYSTLSATSLNHDHPRWIGAWWLGFLVCSVVNFLLSIPTSMIPERLSSIRKPAKKEKKGKGEKEEDEEEDEEEEEEEEERRCRRSSANVRGSKRVSVSSPMPHWTELPNAILRLVSNPIYTLSSIAICIDCFIYGFMAFLPKYFEIEFGKAAWMANLLGGMIPAVFSGCSSFAGGILSGKIKGRDDGVTGNAWIDFVFSLLSFVLLIPAMLIYCPENTYNGQLIDNRLSFVTECNHDCRCPSGVFDPVCGSDGRSYLSPCLAGCSSIYSPTNGVNDTHRKIRFADCRCVNTDGEGGGGVGGWGFVYEGSCDVSCDVIVIAYVIVLAFFFVAVNFYNVPCTNIILRCIDEADKSLALGLQTVGICLMVFPTPIIYGSVFDGTCILRESAPCSESSDEGEGDCLAYDRHSLRWALHGLTVGLRAVTTVLHLVVYVLAKRKLAKLGAENTIMQNMNGGQATHDNNQISPHV